MLHYAKVIGIVIGVNALIFLSIPVSNYTSLLNNRVEKSHEINVEPVKSEIAKKKEKPANKPKVMRAAAPPKTALTPIARTSIAMDLSVDAGEGSENGVAIAGGIGAEMSYDAASVDEQAVIIKSVPLELPKEVVDLDIHGEVVYVVTINEKGSVSHVEILSQPSGFDFTPIIKELSRKWVYRPARIQGLAVSQRLQENFLF